MQPIAFRLVGDQVEPIDLGGDYSIVDAAVGPDGAAYFLAHNNAERSGHINRGIRVKDGERSEFLRAPGVEDDHFEALSIDMHGRLYLAYGAEGTPYPPWSLKWWLLAFPTEDIISGSPPD